MCTAKIIIRHILGPSSLNSIFLLYYQESNSFSIRVVPCSSIHCLILFNEDLKDDTENLRKIQSSLTLPNWTPSFTSTASRVGAVCHSHWRWTKILHEVHTSLSCNPLIDIPSFSIAALPSSRTDPFFFFFFLKKKRINNL